MDMVFNDCDIPAKIQCPVCASKNKCHRVYSVPKFIFVENSGPESCKPDSYWTNAEANRLKDQAQRRKEKQEKIFYNDKDAPKK